MQSGILIPSLFASLYTHVKVQLNALPPNGETIHRKGSLLTSFLNITLRCEEKCKPYLPKDVTFAQLKEEWPIRYERSIKNLLETKKYFPSIWF